jgi:hypothetical protein
MWVVVFNAKSEFVAARYFTTIKAAVAWDWLAWCPDGEYAALELPRKRK